MLSDQKFVKNKLLCSCRQPPAEIRNVSGHLKSANPDFSDFRIKIDNLQATASAADLPENLKAGCSRFLLSVMLASEAVLKLSQIKTWCAKSR